MPGMNGFDTLANLRSDEETAGIPVIIASAISREETDSPFDLAGWVGKPLDERSLLETLEHALGLEGRQPRIMIVEDDQDLARVIKASFERHGIKTFHAQSSSTEAIELSRELTPDLLILDLVLPGLDGLGVVDFNQLQAQTAHSTGRIRTMTQKLDWTALREHFRERLRARMAEVRVLADRIAAG